MKAKDLAKQLGVSPATISLVLNNKPGISDSLRKSLLEKIQALGHEEMLCQACRDGASPGEKPPEREEDCACKSIAYLVCQEEEGCSSSKEPDNYFFSGALEGIEAEAWDNDCCLVMIHANSRKNVSIAEQLRRSGNVIGAIIHPYAAGKRVEDEIRKAGIPCVFVDVYGHGQWQPSAVCISNRQGMENVVRYLKGKGHQEIGYVSSGWETQVEIERRRCYQQSLKDYGLADREEFYFRGGTGHDLYEYQRLADLFQKAERLPTALVCENDRQAWRTVKALQSIGKRVPEDVSVVGFDDEKLCTMIEPNITTIHNSPQLMGRQCVIMLKNLLRLKELGDPDPWLRYELPARLVERDSVRDLTQKS